MSNEISPRENYIEGLKTLPFEELLDELQHASKKTGQYDSRFGGSDEWNVAMDEVAIVRAELIRRFGDE